MLTLALSSGEAILVIALVAIPVAALSFAGAGRVYREIGKGDFAMDHEAPEDGGGHGAPAAAEARRAEVRQMLEAKALRQRERGERPLDVEAEAERLLSGAAAASGADPELVREVRELVIARNERRLRQGKEPLDVEAEVRRQLSELEGP